jgi:hypothetical protein
MVPVDDADANLRLADYQGCCPWRSSTFDRMPEAGRKPPSAPERTGRLVGAGREQKHGEKL